jgi:chromosome segregation ATPase
MQAAIEGAGGVMPLFSSAMSGMGASAGLVLAPLALLAGAMYEAGESLRAPSAAEVEFADATARIAEDAAAAKKAVDDLTAVIAGHAEGVETAGASLEILRDKLMECFDADGNLREGMEQTAQYILDELNAAMGTDYSTAFISQAEDSAAALAEVNASIDQNVEAMKRQALQAVLMDDYTAAIKAQADAQKSHNEATNNYRTALDNAKAAQAAWLEQVRIGKDNTVDNTAEMVKAKAAYDRATEALGDAERAMIDSTEAAVEANNQVAELDRTMDLLAAGGTDAIDNAAKAYANVGDQAETAGKKAADMATTAARTARDEIQSTADQTAAKLKEVGNMTIPAPKIDTASAVNSAANAKNAIQDFFNRNPITSFVHAITRTVATREAYADGGFITEEQVARVGEGGEPEVIIPLSPGKRRRAQELFEKTADILETDMATLPEPAGLDADRLYNAVKSGAEDAVMKVYLDDREVGRTLRGMGFK